MTTSVKLLASTSAMVENDIGSQVKDIDGNIYKTVTIGEQTWLAENLRTTRFQEGAQVKTGVIPNNDKRQLIRYGRLYDWHDVVDQRNLCPLGFRVATDQDWQTLERFIGIAETELNKEGWRGDNDVALSLKAEQPNGLFKRFDKSLINKYQFSATPAGVKVGRWYLTQGMYTEFWTQTSATADKAFVRTLAYAWWNLHKGEIRRTKLNKNYMLSVRCIKI